MVDAGERCGLKWSSYAYVKYGECGRVREEMKDWNGGFPSTVCCRNALTAVAEALALQARNSSSLFPSQNEWGLCPRALGVSCGFDDTLYRASAAKCSNITMYDLRDQGPYQSALDKCSHFDRPFDLSCADCTSAVLGVRDLLYDRFVGKDNNNNNSPTETAVCGIAALVSVAAGNADDPSIPDKFLRCLPLEEAKGTIIARIE